MRDGAVWLKRVIFSDVDGTLTPDRRTSMLDLEAVKVARKLTKYGVYVVLVSGNSLPVLRGVSIYSGLGGYVVAENGAAIYTNKPIKACRDCEAVNKAYRILLDEGDEFIDTWQNPFRLCDKALKWVGDERKAIQKARDILNEHNLNQVEVVTSGYAIHLHPKGCDKGSGIKAFLNNMGLSKEAAYCIGDGQNDIPMKKACGKLIAVSNADEALKRVADLVTLKPSSKGFIEVAEKILENII
jgi:phosphoglycolate phosphatase (TIGR01487 family)